MLLTLDITVLTVTLRRFMLLTLDITVLTVTLRRFSVTDFRHYSAD